MISQMIVFGFLGYLTHLLMSYSEYKKINKLPDLQLWNYINIDLPSWIASTIGSFTVVSLAPDVLLLAHVEAVSPRLMAALLGYVGSSALAKLACMTGLSIGDR